MLTYQQALVETTARFEQSGSATPKLDALVLLSYVTKKDKIHLYAYPQTCLTQEEYGQFEGLVARREKAEPIAYILEEKGFWDIDLHVEKGVLIPRADTETLVEAALLAMPDKKAPLHICDLGTGTGAIILALLHTLENATAVAVDLSEAALKCAQKNATTLGLSGRVSFTQSCWFASVPEQKFDVIVSNPPYIPEADMPTLMRDVRCYEPELALVGGADGLEAYRAILGEIPAYLAPGGWVFFEVGQGQAPDMAQIFEKDTFWQDVQIKKDLAGIERVVFARGGREKI